jgi:inositol-hexakisphosphate/diphosphoinositol-pentakisphosphate 1-kinase
MSQIGPSGKNLCSWVRSLLICCSDFLIAFFSEGFPLDKAIEYVKLRKPFVVNDLPMQKILWDRRLCLRILDQMQVPTPKRLEVNRDGGPAVESAEMAQHLKNMSGVTLQGKPEGGTTTPPKIVEMPDDDTLVVDGKSIKKPFVEKPVSGEDHNIIIYFPRSHEGGGGRRLFRKVGNKSSEFDPKLIVPRAITEPNGSFVYEQFLKTENAEDVKAYTVGPDFCHAETRKSPVVDGLVKRNTHGKEVRYVTNLSPAEKEMAARVSRGFGQRICGFDMLRANGQSFVIDVNGWSFVKDNERYYNECAKILRSLFSHEKAKAALRSYSGAEDTSSEGAPEHPSRRDTATSVGGSHSHRNALKSVFKSPSISKLSHHLPHSRHHQTAPSSPKTSTPPVSSPPTIERTSQSAVLGSNIPEPNALLPPPSIPTNVVSEPDLLNSTVGPAEHSEATEVVAPMPSSKHSWKLKGVVTVIRHADRTPKQKIKLTAHSQVFVDLLKGHHEEVLLKGEAALASVEAAVKVAQRDNLEDQDKLRNLRNALARKRSHPATKVQIKPMFRKRKPEERVSFSAESMAIESPIPEDSIPPPTPLSPAATDDLKKTPTRSDSISGPTFSRYAAAENDLVLDKMQLVMKWGGEPTHSARYQSSDLGTNMREDFMLLNRKVLDDVRIFTSSEKRVRTSAQIWAASFLGRGDISEESIHVRKDLLDDSNAAKDVMDKVKKKLKHLLREGNSVPEEFAWPKDVPEPFVVMQTVIELMRFHRKVLRYNFKKLTGGAAASLAALGDTKDNGMPKDAHTKDPDSIQARWCTNGDNPDVSEMNSPLLLHLLCGFRSMAPLVREGSEGLNLPC